MTTSSPSTKSVAGSLSRSRDNTVELEFKQHVTSTTCNSNVTKATQTTINAEKSECWSRVLRFIAAASARRAATVPPPSTPVPLRWELAKQLELDEFVRVRADSWLENSQEADLSTVRDELSQRARLLTNPLLAFATGEASELDIYAEMKSTFASSERVLRLVYTSDFASWKEIEEEEKEEKKAKEEKAEESGEESSSMGSTETMASSMGSF